MYQNLSNARLQDESFQNYKERRKLNKSYLKHVRRGTLIFSTETFEILEDNKIKFRKGISFANTEKKERRMNQQLWKELSNDYR